MLALLLVSSGLGGSAAALAARVVTTAWSDAFDSYNTSLWLKSDGWTNGAPFAVGWRADHVSVSGGRMAFQLDNVPCPSGCSGMPYASGEYRTIDNYGYGHFETRMQAAAASGVVSSFFTYTGPTEHPPAPHDEIDVEILGEDPTSVQTNYFVAGVGGHEVVTPLGFDASQGFHTYAFDWVPGQITWYVDSVAIRTVQSSSLPTNPGKVMMNLWAGRGVDAWLGPFQYTGPLHAYYDSAGYTPSGTTKPRGH